MEFLLRKAVEASIETKMYGAVDKSLELGREQNKKYRLWHETVDLGAECCNQSLEILEKEEDIRKLKVARAENLSRYERKMNELNLFWKGEEYKSEQETK